EAQHRHGDAGIDRVDAGRAARIALGEAADLFAQAVPARDQVVDAGDRVVDERGVVQPGAVAVGVHAFAEPGCEGQSGAVAIDAGDADGPGRHLRAGDEPVRDVEVGAAFGPVGAVEAFG